MEDQSRSRIDHRRIAGSRISDMPYDQMLAQRVRDALTEKGIEFEAKPIMGMLCFMVNGTLCAGILDQHLIVRIDPGDEPAALAKPNCKPMYFTGRPMKDFMFIDPDGTCSREQVLEWLEFALKVSHKENGSKRQLPSNVNGVSKEELPKRSNNSEPGHSAGC